MLFWSFIFSEIIFINFFKDNIIRITVFPLDDKFVFGDILFFWLIFCNFLRNERRGILVRAAAYIGGCSAFVPPPRSGAAASAAKRTKTPRRSFRKNVAKYSAKKTKYSPTNEFTHPTGPKKLLTQGKTITHQ